MKDLLTAIKTELQANLSGVRDSDVFITEHADLIPDTVRFPATGLKDGPVTRKELSGGMWEVTLTTTIIVYVQLVKDGAAVMGDDSINKKGVLEITDDIHVLLDENLLDISGMQSAFSPEESESEPVSIEEEMIQQKSITYFYVKEEARP